MKGGSKRDVRVPIDPPLSGYEDVKPRLLEMKALAQEGLGMVRLQPTTNLQIITFELLDNRSKLQKSHPLTCQQGLPASLDSFALPFSTFTSFKNYPYHHFPFPMLNKLYNFLWDSALGLFL